MPRRYRDSTVFPTFMSMDSSPCKSRSSFSVNDLLADNAAVFDGCLAGVLVGIVSMRFFFADCSEGVVGLLDLLLESNESFSMAGDCGTVPMSDAIP